MKDGASRVEVHRAKLIRILADIYADPRLARSLGFKGGTAAYFCYSLPRVSVDLDFNLLDSREEQYVLGRIKQILPKYGEVVDATIKYYTVFFLLKYAVGSWRIKIEISRRPSPASYQLRSVMGIGMQAMVEEDMAACKLAALLTRKTMVMRDVFDIWYFLSQEWEINEEVFRAQTEWGLAEGIERAIAVVGKLKKSELLQGVAELLTQSQRVWMRENIRRDLLVLLRARLEAVKGRG